MEKFNVWLHIEKATDPDTENETFEDQGMPEKVGQVNTLDEAQTIVNTLMKLMKFANTL